MKNLEITDVKTILTAPEGIDLVVVKIETNEPGLYEVGCATFTQRYLSVATTIQINNTPGLGIDIDEEKAAMYPCENVLPKWTLARRPDGTSARP